MLQLTPLSVIFVANCFIDFRKGIDGLAAVCRNILIVDPLSGSLFLFYNKRLTCFKILAYDGQGFTLFTKRLSQGKFKANPLKDFSHKGLKVSKTSTDYQHCSRVCHRMLQVLIGNGDPLTVSFSTDWKPLGGN